MIIKSKDDTQPAIGRLQQLLARKTITKKQRDALEDELARVLSGAEGEREAAYQIDFELKDSKNWAVIHDLRLEHNGRVAQIDHLLIGRFLDIFVIESKNYKTPLRVDANDEFRVRTRWGWKGIDSPIEQNKKHIIVLNDLINSHKLTPMRLGLPMRPNFRNWILIPSECHISQRRVEEAIILKMDMFGRRLQEFMNSNSSLTDVISLAKICSTQTIMEFARKLVTFHRPSSIDFATKCGLPPTAGIEDRGAAAASKSAHAADLQLCQACGVPVDAKVAAYCRANSRKFSKRILCRVCQHQVTAAERDSAAPHPTVAKSNGGSARTGR